ncbi:hypothetical protein [Streptomyces sp. NPDC048669]|uniref:hypothetical protein n=1 Tax=Streptomyces sp. NPDC048669 TaxID=3155267 RepID=UPI00342CAB2F
MNAASAAFDVMVAAYMPRVIAAFDRDPGSYELTASSFIQLLEDAAESYDGDDVDSENLMNAAGYVDKATRADEAGERFCRYIRHGLDGILAAREQA